MDGSSVCTPDDQEVAYNADDVPVAAFGDFGRTEANEVADDEVSLVFRNPASRVWLVRRGSDTLEAAHSAL